MGGQIDTKCQCPSDFRVFSMSFHHLPTANAEMAQVPILI